MKTKIFTVRFSSPLNADQLNPTCLLWRYIIKTYCEATNPEHRKQEQTDTAVHTEHCTPLSTGTSFLFWPSADGSQDQHGAHNASAGNHLSRTLQTPRHPFRPPRLHKPPRRMAKMEQLRTSDSRGRWSAADAGNARRQLRHQRREAVPRAADSRRRAGKGPSPARRGREAGRPPGERGPAGWRARSRGAGPQRPGPGPGPARSRAESRPIPSHPIPPPRDGGPTAASQAGGAARGGRTPARERRRSRYLATAGGVPLCARGPESRAGPAPASACASSPPPPRCAQVPARPTPGPPRAIGQRTALSAPDHRVSRARQKAALC